MEVGKQREQHSFCFLSFSSQQLKQRFSFLKLKYGDLYSVLDAVKVCFFINNNKNYVKHINEIITMIRKLLWIIEFMFAGINMFCAQLRLILAELLGKD